MTKTEIEVMNKTECLNILQRALKCDVAIPDAPATRRVRIDGVSSDELGRRSLLCDHSKTGEIFRTIVMVRGGITSHQIANKANIGLGVVSNVLTRLYKRDLVLREKKGAQYFYFV